MSDNIITGSDDNFKAEVLESSVPVLVDFWAPWCGPCKALAPALEEIAEEFKGKLKVVKVDIDENPEVPSSYSVRSIPTLHIFKDGESSVQKVGAMSKSALKDMVKQALGL